MTVPVRWMLSQPDLALELKGGAAGLGNEITFAHTTELQDPFRWLSGGELLLTTGIRLPLTAADRARYLRGLGEAGVAAVGFGTGLSHPEVPEDLVVVADEIGLPLLEIPLPTPFAAVVKRVMNRLAEQEYEAVLRASRAQPRMTRAVIQGGTGATVRELAVATSSTVLLLDLSGRVLEAHPAQPAEDVLGELRDVLEAGTGGASSSVSLARSGASITVQQISVGSTPHGHLAVISPTALSHVDQILLGHANSLLALDFEKPVRLRTAQNRLNSHALGLLLTEDRDLAPAWSQIRHAADAEGMVRGLTVVAETSALAERAESAVAVAMNKAGRQLFSRRHDARVTVLLRGTDDADFARAMLRTLSGPERKAIRAGLSGRREVAALVAAIEQSQLAASAAEAGADPLEFAALTGSALLAFSSTREVLNSLADTMISPIDDYDRTNGTELLGSLRAFLEANGHWESAAAAMGVHRHTLRSRMARIESLIDCRLDVARVRAELLLAIIARQS
ncbi:PucR family transcriptional regulator [Rhodococcus opacus]|uniref:Putative CdaR family transcriptional regulator n=1 Tax=Rhodococcus opacus (strain B4) TaxID=632772 RepID=C1AWZ4_RHOOB|nr:PucR family transcriptional regulator [Rhodococcus opacus]BAH53917.1 putative CdaR family transcriptional regulator [Rhodococcus opacus B4]